MVMAEFTQDGVSYRVPAKSYYFRREHSGNHKCAACGAPLWSALNPDAWRRQKKWAKIGDYGFVYRPLVYEHFKKAGGEGQLQKSMRFKTTRTPAFRPEALTALMR